jgi:hypothetical protein
MIINKANEIEQNNNPYKDALLSYKIESMERKYNAQFRLNWLRIVQHSYKYDAVCNAHPLFQEIQMPIIVNI